MACSSCDEKTCPGPNKLREFADWADLSAHLDEEKIVEFINKYAAYIDQRNASGKAYRVRQQTFTKLAFEHLDKDEIEAVRKASRGEV